jgi:hypothetical protein
MARTPETQSLNAKTALPRIMSAADLMTKDIKPPKFIVPRYIPEGLSLLAGRPKVGKSWLLGNIALAAAGGLPVLKQDVEAGDVLWLSLEDTERRLQHRMGLMLNGAPAPGRLFIATSWPALDCGGTDAIENWVNEMPHPRLIVVDVFARVRPRVSGASRLYEADYEAALPLKSLADAYGIAAIACCHARKEQAAIDPFEAVNATTGLTGAADTVLILDRDREGTSLYGRGRDVEEFRDAVRFDASCGTWRQLGDAAEVSRSPERNAILNALKGARDPLGPNDIAKRSGVSDASVRHLLARMVAAGDVIREGRGRYRLSPLSPIHNVHNDHIHSSFPLSLNKEDERDVNDVNDVNGKQWQNTERAPF